MIEAIKDIGAIRISGKEDGKEFGILDSFLENPPQKTKKKLHTIILNYDIFEKKIGFDFEEIKEDTAQKYLWLGNRPSNNPQVYFTTSNLNYLISEVIPNLAGKAPKKSRFSNLLNQVIEAIFYDLGLQDKRRKFVINLEKCGIVEKGYLQELKRKVDEGKRKSVKEPDIFKDIINNIRAEMYNFISEESKGSLKKGDIGLYTLKINGRLMVEDEEYQRLVINEKIDILFGEKKKVCSFCGEYQPITDRPKFAKARSALGYYITDKIGFSSELSDDFTKNFVVCKGCYKKLLVGEVFVRNNLSSYIGGLNLYIIPKFLFPAKFGSRQINKWAEYIQFTFNSAKSFEGLEEFEKQIEKYQDFEDAKNNLILNLLFFKAKQAELKVLKVVKDVPPTRVETLIRTTNEIKDIGDKILGESVQWSIDFNNIYYLIPLKRTQNEVEYRKILSLYDSIFSGKPVSYNFLITQFVELGQVYRFEKFNAYNIGRIDRDVGLVYALLKANLLILYLKRLNLLNGGKGMDYDSLQLNEEIKDFLKEMEYDERKVAVFLLGSLIGDVGKAQYKKGPSKPILGKITYQGMNKSKLVRLSNEVFEKLIEYKQLQFNEGIFAEYKRLMDKHFIPNPLSDQENVFYVLSGYAFATQKAIKSKQQGDEKTIIMKRR